MLLRATGCALHYVPLQQCALVSDIAGNACNTMKQRGEVPLGDLLSVSWSNVALCGLTFNLNTSTVARFSFIISNVACSCSSLRLIHTMQLCSMKQEAVSLRRTTPRCFMMLQVFSSMLDTQAYCCSGTKCTSHPVALSYT